MTVLMDNLHFPFIINVNLERIRFLFVFLLILSVLHDDDVDDEDALMQQVLAMSRMEYVENLQKQSSTSDDNN